MRISRKAEYALRALVLMARQPRSWQIQELSVREQMPVKFLEQILLGLRHAGILNSKRGVGGGYVLRKPATEITVAEVIRTFDGPLSLLGEASEASGESASGPERLRCPVRIFFAGVQRDLAETLERQSIEDLVRLVPAGGELAFDI